MRLLLWDSSASPASHHLATASGSSASRCCPEELRGYLRSGGRFDFHGLLDPTLLLHKSRIQGAALELTEIRDVLLLADRASEWREIALHHPVAIEAKWEAVRELSQNVADFTEMLRYFRNKIQPDGTLDDRASPELWQLAAISSASGTRSSNRCSRTCADWPMAAPSRTN